MRWIRACVRKVLSKTQIALLKKMKLDLSGRGLRLIARSRLLSKVYLVLLSDAFDREALAVIEGRIRHVDNQLGGEQTNYCLRRAIHRLEKGLSMAPRRRTFGLDYIGEAVSAFERNESLNPEERRWASDVLANYFENVDEHPIVEAARSRYLARRNTDVPEFEPDMSRRVPYRRHTVPETNIRIEMLHGLASRRRSVRWFRPQHVPRELIDKSIEIAALSPSACNRQPYRFRVFDQRDLVDVVASLPPGVSGFGHNIPVLVVLIGQLRAYFHERDRHLIYIDGGLAAMSFMLALETVGLSSCPINWPDIASRDKAMSALLGLSADERTIMCIGVGYADPDGLIPYSEKIPLETLREYNAVDVGERVSA